MAFIRKKRQANGETLYQVVESRREGAKVRQRLLVSLSHSATIADRIEEVDRLLGGSYLGQRWRQHYTALREKLARVRSETGLP